MELEVRLRSLGHGALLRGSPCKFRGVVERGMALLIRCLHARSDRCGPFQRNEMREVLELKEEVLVEGEDGIEPLQEILYRVASIVAELEGSLGQGRVDAVEQGNNRRLEATMALAGLVGSPRTLEEIAKCVLERAVSQRALKEWVLMKVAK